MLHISHPYPYTSFFICLFAEFICYECAREIRLHRTDQTACAVEIIVDTLTHGAWKMAIYIGLNLCTRYHMFGVHTCMNLLHITIFRWIEKCDSKCWLSRYSRITQKRGQHIFMFFLHVFDLHYIHEEQKLQSAGFLLHHMQCNWRAGAS